MLLRWQELFPKTKKILRNSACFNCRNFPRELQTSWGTMWILTVRTRQGSSVNFLWWFGEWYFSKGSGTFSSKCHWMFSLRQRAKHRRSSWDWIRVQFYKTTSKYSYPISGWNWKPPVLRLGKLAFKTHPLVVSLVLHANRLTVVLHTVVLHHLCWMALSYSYCPLLVWWCSAITL